MEDYAIKIAVLHIDADAFFASCEQAINPEYKGKPVITGKERGIVSAASYEAKRMGVSRGIPLFKVKEICPDAIILPSDYETYSLFSKRMFSIIKRFTPTVEEYSIDEAFADITGLRRPLKMSYQKIAETIKNQIEKELGITVSIGLASTKVLAKVGSKWNKPSGLTIINSRDTFTYLKNLAVEKIWGIGPQTTSYLNKHRVETALEFSRLDERWIKSHLTKPYLEIWKELNGESVYNVECQEKDDYKSISKFKTFTPPSKNRSFIYSQLSKNLENALIKLRRHNLAGKKISVILRTQDFRDMGLEAKLTRLSNLPKEIIPIVDQLFNQIFNPRKEYRATGIIISNLEENKSTQLNLFENPIKIEKTKNLYELIDGLSSKYGKHTVFLASSLGAKKQRNHQNERGDISLRLEQKLGRLSERKFLNLPFFVGNVK